MALIVAMIVTMLLSPAIVWAADGDGGDANTDEAITYINSDESERTLYRSEEGYLYEHYQFKSYEEDEIDLSGTTAARVLGYNGGAEELDVPETLGGEPVRYVYINPKNSLTQDDTVSQVVRINLPTTLRRIELKQFKKLEAVTVTEGNPYFWADDGVLYYYNASDGGYNSRIYPAAKKDESYKIPGSVTSFSSSNSYLKSITIPASWDENHASSPPNLQNIFVEEGSAYAVSVDGVLYSKDLEQLLVYPKGRTETEYRIADGVKNLSLYPFSDTKLTKLVLPESIQTMNGHYYGPTGLKVLEFTGKTAPDPKDFRQIHTLLESYKDIEILYPEDGEGYEDFVTYFKKKLNAWGDMVQLEIDTVPLGSNPIIHDWGYSDYGEEYLVYSKTEDGEYSKALPTSTGAYYVKVIVDETDEYTGLESRPLEISVTDAESKPAKNTIYEFYGRGVSYGWHYNILAQAKYGTPVIQYRPANDTSQKWTTEKPTAVGTYDVRAVVEATEDYEGAEATRTLTIWKGENNWDTSPSCPDIVEGEMLSPRAEAAYGDVQITYYTEDGTEPLTVAPTKAGSYKAVFTVEETDGYEGLQAKRTFQIKHKLTKHKKTAATCTEDGNYRYWACDVCGKCFRDKEGNTEIPKKYVIIPATGHQYGKWQVVEEPTCTEEGNAERECSECGEKETLTLSPKGHVWKDHATVDKEATCTEAGSQSIHCKVCDAVQEGSEIMIEPLGHEYTEAVVVPTCSQEGCTLHVCGRCGDSYTDGETPAKGHSFGDWIVDTDSTCTSEGSQHRICAECGYTETKGIDKKEHSFSGEYTIDKEATCTTDGSKSYHCTSDGCSATTGSVVIPAKGHQYTEWEITRPATCTEEGSAERTCPECGLKETIHFEATGHIWMKEPTVDKQPTCTEDGEESIHCAVCDAKKEDSAKPVAELGHAWDAGVITTPATYELEGVMTYTCTTCGKTRTEVIPGLKRTSIEDAVITEVVDQTYNGEALQQAPQVVVGRMILLPGIDYTLAYENNIDAGTAAMMITGIGAYEGTVRKDFVINKADNPLSAKAKKLTLKYGNVKKKKQTAASEKVFTISDAQGDVTYKVSAYDSKAKKKITVSKSGTVTVKTGLGKGTYKLTVKVTAAGDANYNAGTQTVILTVRIK